jgi:hypothetical protein
MGGFDFTAIRNVLYLAGGANEGCSAWRHRLFAALFTPAFIHGPLRVSWSKSGAGLRMSELSA